MKGLLAAVVVAGIGIPAVAWAGPAECRRLESRIDHFEGMLERARLLENEMWEGRMEQQVDLLKARASVRCPDFEPDDQTAERIEQLLKLAGKAALTYFTFGAF